MKAKSIDLFNFQPIGAIRIEQQPDGWLTIWPAEGTGQLLLSGDVLKRGSVDWQNATHLVLDITGLDPFNPAFVLVFADRSATGTPSFFNAGALPGIRVKMAFPLTALNAQQMFMKRTPGSLKQIIIGQGIDMAAVTDIVLATKKCHQDQHILIHDIFLSQGEPDYTFDHQPIVDRLGQLKTRDWPGKTSSEEDMVMRLKAEVEQIDPVWQPSGRSRYGGDLSVRWESTGFFRTHYDGYRWCLVDPDGYRFISTGLDCCALGDPGLVSDHDQLYEELPDKNLFSEAWNIPDEHAHIQMQGDFVSYSTANLMRTFGSDWLDYWTDLTRHRLKNWRFNTIGNWSSPDFIRQAKMPYVWPLADFPTTSARIFRDFPDVFSAEYTENAMRFASQLAPLTEDPLLIGYFLRNEPEWAFVHDLLIADKVLESPVLTDSKRQFICFLMSRYIQVSDLNAAWQSDFLDFEDLYSPQTVISGRSEMARRDSEDFSREMIRRYAAIPSEACKAVDPNHLNLGMRYSMLTNPILIEGYDHFDVFSLNGYQDDPYSEVQKVGELTGKPVIIGEFHFGAIDAGLTAAGICSVLTQVDRGLAYRQYFQKGLTSPYFVGAHYFILNDQPLIGRFDGENMQIGLVDVCNRPYAEFVDKVSQTNNAVYDMADGKVENTTVEIKRIPRLMGF